MEQLIYLSLAATTTAIIILLAYPIFLHPLARTPGPLLAKLSDLRHFYQIVKGDRHEWLWQLHQRYGHLVRIGPNTLSVDSVEGLQAIYSTSAPTDKSPFYKPFAGGHPCSFNAMGNLYKERKSIILPAFAPKRLQYMEPIMISYIQRFCTKLTATSEANIDEFLSALSVDILTDLCFGETFSTLENVEEGKKICEGLDYSLRCRLKEGTLWRSPSLAWIFRQTVPGSRRTYVAQRGIEAMMKQKRSPSGKEDIFTNLLNAKKPGTNEPYSDQELFGEAITLLVAGTDTLAAALTTIIWHLLSTPSTWTCLVKEVRGQFHSVDDISNSKLTHLPYLQAVIEEGLRISPPNPGYIPRLVLNSKETFVLHNTVIPPGTEVGISSLALHRNALYFDDPNSFRPERWLDNGPKCDKEAFAPFSRGPRACIGRSMAYMEMSLTLAILALQMDLEFQDPLKEARTGFRVEDVFGVVKPTVAVRVSLPKMTTT